MHAIKFTEKIIVKENAETIFDYTQNYNNRLKWDTFLKQADLVGGATKAGKGVKAYCVAHNGFGMETEYVTFNRPKVTAIKMTKGPYLFRLFFGSWTFKELELGKTEVVFLYSFDIRFPFNLLSFFIKRNLQRNVRQRLLDLKKCIEREEQMKDLLPYIINRCLISNTRYEVHSFDSGAIMIDIWSGEDFYVIQIFGKTIGLSLIDKRAPPLDLVPDRTFEESDEFKTSFEKIFYNKNEQN